MSGSTACLNIINGSVSNTTPSTFGNGSGAIYIVESEDCWNAVVADLDNQIALAGEGLALLRALHYPTGIVEDAIAEISAVRGYATGLVTYTRWQWDQATLVNGDTVGMCYYQASGSSSENHASCWAFDFQNGEYGGAKSYLLKPSSIGSNSTLNDYSPIDPSIPFGTKGSWITTQPTTAFDTTKTSIGIRFSPAAPGPADPSIKIGTAEVVTYVASRPSTNSAAETESLFSSDIRRLQQTATDNFIANNRWQSEQVELACYSEATCYVPPTPGDDDGDDGVVEPPAPPTIGATYISVVATILASSMTLLAF